jgi:hypothetical protein
VASGDFADLSARACRAAQFDPTDTDDLARAKEAVNEAYLSVCHDGNPWDFLEKEGVWTTTAGSDVYTYATIATAIGVSGASIREIVRMVNDTTGGVLESFSWTQVEDGSYSTQEAGEGQGTPTTWAKWGNANAPEIRLYPTPDAVYSLGTFCYVTPDEMSADADVPLIPLAWAHRVIVPYAAALLLEQDGGSEAGADYDRRMARYRDAHEQMRVALGTGKRPTFNVVAPDAFQHLPGSGDYWGYWS